MTIATEEQETSSTTVKEDEYNKLIEEILSKLTIKCDVHVSDKERERIRRGCLSFAKELLSANNSDRASLVSLSEFNKKHHSIGESAAKSIPSSFSVIPSSLPPYLPYSPITNPSQSPFVQSKQTNTQLFYIGSTDLWTPYVRPGVLTVDDYANLTGLAPGTFKSFRFRGYPKGILRSIKISLFYTGNLSITLITPATRFFSNTSNQTTPWQLWLQRSVPWRYGIPPNSANEPGNTFLEWKTLDQLSAQSTAHGFFQGAGDYRIMWWEIDLPGGIEVNSWDFIGLTTGQSFIPGVERFYVSGKLECPPPSLQFEGIDYNVVALTSLSNILEANP